MIRVADLLAENIDWPNRWANESQAAIADRKAQNEVARIKYSLIGEEWSREGWRRMR